MSSAPRPSAGHLHLAVTLDGAGWHPVPGDHQAAPGRASVRRQRDPRERGVR